MKRLGLSRVKLAGLMIVGGAALTCLVLLMFDIAYGLGPVGVKVSYSLMGLAAVVLYAMFRNTPLDARPHRLRLASVFLLAVAIGISDWGKIPRIGNVLFVLALVLAFIGSFRVRKKAGGPDSG